MVSPRKDHATSDDGSSSRLMYREDDDNFKNRLNTVIQMSWVYNTVLTILVVLAIFYLLSIPLYMGLLMGILIALLSNLYATIGRVTQAGRWEVYRNRVVMPRGFRGGTRTIQFKDITSIERDKGMTGEALVVILESGERLHLDVSEQQKPLVALELAYRQFSRLSKGSMEGISILVKEEPPMDRVPVEASKDADQ